MKEKYGLLLTIFKGKKSEIIAVEEDTIEEALDELQVSIKAHKETFKESLLNDRVVESG